MSIGSGGIAGRIKSFRSNETRAKCRYYVQIKAPLRPVAYYLRQSILSAIGGKLDKASGIWDDSDYVSVGAESDVNGDHQIIELNTLYKQEKVEADLLGSGLDNYEILDFRPLQEVLRGTG